MQLQKPSRRARVAMLAAGATFALAAPASAAPTASIDAAGKLTVNFAGSDEVVLSAQNGNVKLGADELAIPAADVKTIEVLEDAAGTDANTVDLSAVTAATYPQLTSTLIKATGGADTLTGTQLDDRIEGGRQNDTMNGRDGDDTTVWRPGEGSDVMNGGDGVDIVEVNGGGGGETFETKTQPGSKRLLFERSAPAGTEFTLDIGGAERLVDLMGGGDDVFKGNDVSTLPATVNGGDGNDNITGTVAGDTLAGAAGNDTIAGARGNDDMSGDDGDDLLVWNPGDGSDKFEGGAGNDVAQDNGGNAAEHFVVSANGQRVTATRDTGAPFFLDIGTSETLDLNANGGNDSVDVNNGLAALIKVDANLGDGDDSIRTRNDSAELVDGAGGADTAQVDATDQVSNVETVDAPVVTPPRGDEVAPKAAVKSRRLKVNGGRAAVRISLPAGESETTGRIRIVRGGKVVGSRAVEIAGGQTKTFKVALKRKTRIALSKAPGKKLKATVKIELTDAAGNTAKSSKRLELKG
jgi:Ca2+-binding RTX toxin-like protein